MRRVGAGAGVGAGSSSGSWIITVWRKYVGRPLAMAYVFLGTIDVDDIAAGTTGQPRRHGHRPAEGATSGQWFSAPGLVRREGSGDQVGR